MKADSSDFDFLYFLCVQVKNTTNPGWDFFVCILHVLPLFKG